METAKERPADGFETKMSQTDSKHGHDQPRPTGTGLPSTVESEEEEKREPSQGEDGPTQPLEDQDGGENALQQVPSQSEKMSKKKVFVIVGALCVAVFLVALDMTIIATALPTMGKVFAVSETGYTWMASSYLLASAAVLPLWGKLSDIWGRRMIILMANLLFLAGSLISAVAKDLATFLGGRVVQGIGGGGLLVLCQICVGDLFSVRERPIYYSLFGAMWSIAGSVGPIVGGALTQEVTWRWCFYLNLPVGGVALFILLFWLNVESPKTPLIAGLRVIDWLGTVCIVGGTIMLLLGLEFGGISFPWDSATTICLLVFGVVVLGIFGLVERTFAKYPIVPMVLFEDMSNLFILGCNWAHASVYIAGAYFLPIYFQTVLGVGPILSGVYILPQVMGVAIFSLVAGVLMRKTGRFVEVIRLGMIMSTLGCGLFIDLKPYASWPRIIIYQLVFGFGVGPNFQAPLIAIQSGMRPGDVASATSTFSFVRQLSTAASMVLGGVVYQNTMKNASSKLIEALGSDLASSFLGTIAGSNISNMHLLTEEQRQVVVQEYTFALSRMWIFYTCINGVGIVFSFFVKKRELSKKHQITKTGLEAQEQARQERIAAKKEKKSMKMKKKNEKDNAAEESPQREEV